MRLKSSAVLIAAALGTFAFAAHKYDMGQSTSLTGTVTKVEWNNKDYVKIHMDAPGKKGNKTDWELQTTSASALRADGITRSNLKKGDQITVQGHPAASGSPHMLATSFTLANGQTIALNGQPSRVQRAENYTPQAAPPPPAESAVNTPPPPPVETAQNTPPPANVAPANPEPETLPRTASDMPLIGLIGLLSLAVGSAIVLRARLS